MSSGSLFPDLQPVVREAEGADGAEQAPAAEADGRQLDLFSDLAVLRRDIGHAVVAGDFEEARRVRGRALETFGPEGLAGEFGFLDVLGRDLWEQPPAVVLRCWQEVDAGLVGRPGLRIGVRDSIFHRLLERHGAGVLAREYPDVLGPLCASLVSLQESFGAGSARALVCDLLLEGYELDARALAYDPAVADLLGEHLSPPWLACLGALRSLWPTPAASPGELDSLDSRAFVPPPSEEDAAAEFWRCLRVSRTPDTPEEVRHEARRRMKKLSPELHAQHMGAVGS